MDEGSPAADYARVREFFETAFELGHHGATLSNRLTAITQVTCENLSLAMHASAIIDGSFLAVTRLAFGPRGNNNIERAFQTIFGAYGSILKDYCNTTAAQVRVIKRVVEKCMEFEPFAPFFRNIIETLKEHFMSNEAITEWKATNQAEEAQGNLSPSEINFLRAMEAIPLMMDMGGLDGLGEADDVARNMGF